MIEIHSIQLRLPRIALWMMRDGWHPRMFFLYYQWILNTYNHCDYVQIESNHILFEYEYGIFRSAYSVALEKVRERESVSKFNENETLWIESSRWGNCRNKKISRRFCRLLDVRKWRILQHLFRSSGLSKRLRLVAPKSTSDVIYIVFGLDIEHVNNMYSY